MFQMMNGPIILNNMNRFKNYYHLNLPKLRDVRNPEFKLDSITHLLGKRGIVRLSPEVVFNESFLDFLIKCEITPSHCVLFYTGPNHSGTPHVDGGDSKTGAWSMNWNMGSRMILNYYKSDELIEKFQKTFKNRSDLINDQGKKSTKGLSEEVVNEGHGYEYLLAEGRQLEKIESHSTQSPFLLRTEIPHSVTNLDDCKRWAFTLRGAPRNTWEEAIELFSKYNLIVE